MHNYVSQPFGTVTRQMDENFESFAIVDHDEQTVSKPRLTLKLPSLKALKAQKPAKPPRPVKLKPLKEVLTRLIAQIKKYGLHTIEFPPF